MSTKKNNDVVPVGAKLTGVNIYLFIYLIYFNILDSYSIHLNLRKPVRFEAELMLIG